MRPHIRIVLIIVFAIFSAKGLKAQHMELPPKNYKVVFQLSNNDTLVHKSLIRQLNNLLEAMDKVTVEVVAHSAGVELLLNRTPFKVALEKLEKRGVVFLVCQNTLNEKKLESGKLLPGVGIVPAGLAHIIVRQSEGWSYIKAGF